MLEPERARANYRRKLQENITHVNSAGQLRRWGGGSFRGLQLMDSLRMLREQSPGERAFLLALGVPL